MAEMVLLAVAGPQLVGVAVFGGGMDGKAAWEKILFDITGKMERWEPEDGMVELFAPRYGLEAGGVEMLMPVSVLVSKTTGRVLIDVAISPGKEGVGGGGKASLVRGHASGEEWDLVTTFFAFPSSGPGRTRFALLQSDRPRATCITPLDGPTGSRSLLRNPVGWRHTGDIWAYGFRRVFLAWNAQGAMEITPFKPKESEGGGGGGEGEEGGEGKGWEEVWGKSEEERTESKSKLVDAFSAFSGAVPGTRRFEVHYAKDGSGKCMVTARESKDGVSVLGDLWTPGFAFYAFTNKASGTKQVMLFHIRDPLIVDHDTKSADDASGYCVLLRTVPKHAKKWRILDRMYVF